MSYGYNSAVAFSLSTATLDDFAIDLLDRLANKRTRKEVSDFFECIFFSGHIEVSNVTV